MKKSLISLLAVMTASLMLLIGASFAETAEDTAATESAASSASAEALEDAWYAYYAAKSAASESEYAQELADMVAQGQLTQEQADLLLKAVQDSAALKNGTCPNCGYEFSCKGMRGGQRRGMRPGRKSFGKH